MTRHTSVQKQPNDKLFTMAWMFLNLRKGQSVGENQATWYSLRHHYLLHMLCHCLQACDAGLSPITSRQDSQQSQTWSPSLTLASLRSTPAEPSAYSFTSQRKQWDSAVEGPSGTPSQSKRKVLKMS